MRRFLALCAMMVFTVALVAQAVPQFEQDYHPVACTGSVPADFVAYCSGTVKKCDANYKLLFSSGLVLYGTPLNEYVESVADRLLENYPELRKQLRFYVLRSTEVNAAAYENGMVVVNTGLLAQLQNESELAFVLAHEIVHIQEGHIQAEREAAKKQRHKTRNDETPFQVMTSSQYRSREHEAEADRLAFTRFFSKTAYSYEALDGVFDVLQYSYLPFDEIPFNRRFIEAACYHFPDEYFLGAVKPVRAREDYVDTLSTHPNLKKRREWVRQQVSLADNSGRSVFLQPEERFREVRDMARFECIDLWLTRHEYADAFYNSYVMAQAYPDNLFLHRALYMSLYGIAMHRQESDIEGVVPAYKEVEGEKQQLCHFLRKVRRQELLTLALRFAWQSHLRFPQDTFSLSVTDALLCSMAEQKMLDYNNFSDFPMDYIPTPIEQSERQSQELTAGNKYERLRQNEAMRTKVLPSEKFSTYNYMLVDLRQDPSFWNHVDSVKGALEDDATLGLITSVRNPLLGGSMALWNPTYFKLKLGGKRTLDRSESMEKMIRKTCKRLKINVTDRESDSLLLSSAESYNHYRKLQQWFTDYLNYEGHSMLYYQSLGIGPACAALGSENLCVVLAYSRPDRVILRYLWYPVIASVLVPLATPVAVTHFFAFEYETKASIHVINAVSSRVLYSNGLEVDEEQTDAYLHDFLYRALSDIKGR